MLGGRVLGPHALRTGLGKLLRGHRHTDLRLLRLPVNRAGRFSRKAADALLVVIGASGKALCIPFIIKLPVQRLVGCLLDELLGERPAPWWRRRQDAHGKACRLLHEVFVRHGFPDQAPGRSRFSVQAVRPSWRAPSPVLHRSGGAAARCHRNPAQGRSWKRPG